ncbi:DUF2459 domain-containing protein [Altererythrobacter lauratis]|uniref:DUF2459 domain-containing protein n=1 Tax=Alteraurantiacibacter lauratis TaxID=2054627 RepID=A0ABV7EBU0_9SPHN
MLAGAALVFLLSAWIGSSLPRPTPASISAPISAPEPSAGDSVTIMVETNGVHTGIIMPIVSAEMDWRAVFPSAGRAVNGRYPTHIAVGWGEREVFLNTPTWADLKLSTALRIALQGGEPVMRVSHYVRPAPGKNFRPLTIARADYARMAEAIAASLAPAGGPHAPLRGVDPHDAYYPARGTYTLAQTCNSWVGDMLAHGGVPMGRWTPFAGGVMKWIDAPSAL